MLSSPQAFLQQRLVSLGVGCRRRAEDCWYGDRVKLDYPHGELLRSAQCDLERTVTLLGATGSIGASTLDLIRRESNRYRVEAVSAHDNVAALAAVAREVGARFAAVGDPDAFHDLKEALAGSGIESDRNIFPGLIPGRFDGAENDLDGILIRF